MMRNFKFDYDYEHDSIFFYDPHSKSKGSVEICNFVVDFNNKKEMVAIEIFNASNLIQDVNLSESKVSKEMLQTIKSCKVDISYNGNFFIFKFILMLDQNKTISASTIIPSITQGSAALAQI